MILNDLLFTAAQKAGYDKDPDIEKQVSDMRKRLVVQRRRRFRLRVARAAIPAQRERRVRVDFLIGGSRKRDCVQPGHQLLQKLLTAFDDFGQRQATAEQFLEWIVGFREGQLDFH